MNPRARVSGWMGCMASASLVLPQRGCKTLRYIPPSALSDTRCSPRLRPDCRSENKEWLRGLDSNQDNQIQSLVCCQLHHPGVVESQYFTDVLRSLQPKLSLNLYGSQAERPLRGEKNDWVGIATPSQNTRRQRDLIATGSSNQSGRAWCKKTISQAERERFPNGSGCAAARPSFSGLTRACHR